MPAPNVKKTVVRLCDLIVACVVGWWQQGRLKGMGALGSCLARKHLGTPQPVSVKGGYLSLIFYEGAKILGPALVGKEFHWFEIVCPGRRR